MTSDLEKILGEIENWKADEAEVDRVTSHAPNGSVDIKAFSRMVMYSSYLEKQIKPVIKALRLAVEQRDEVSEELEGIAPQWLSLEYADEKNAEIILALKGQS